MDESKNPLWYEWHDGSDTVCQDCKAELLRDWGTGPGSRALNSDEVVRASDFKAIGRTPWAGRDEGDRYEQCGHCQGQWGPDA